MEEVEVTKADAPSGVFAPVQTLKLWSAGTAGFIIVEESGNVNTLEEIYCSTPTATDVDSHCFTTVGRLRIHERVAYIDLD